MKRHTLPPAMGAALAALLTGCGPKSPYEGQDRIYAPNCYMYSEDEFYSLRDELAAAWPDPEDFRPGPVTVHCVTDLPEDLPGEWGTMRYQKGEITIWIVITPSLRVSAYLHELVHAHFRREFGTTDPDHAEGDGPWSRRHDQAVEYVMSLGTSELVSLDM